MPSKIIQFMRHLHFWHMNSDRNYYFIRRMTNGAEKEKRRKNSFCKPAKSIAIGLSRVFIGFYTSILVADTSVFEYYECRFVNMNYLCAWHGNRSILSDTRTRGHALNTSIISEINKSISLVLISFAINAIGFVSCLPIINESTNHPFTPLFSLSVR